MTARGQRGDAADERALVLLSGGQDSATCLAWALDRFAAVETIGFFYRQRHAAELERRAPLRAGLAAADAGWAAKLGDDHLIDFSMIADLGQSALTADVAIAIGDSGLPTTFVPGRNLLFLAAPGAIAYRRGQRHLVIGVCETDYSGYPDCRDDTIKAMQRALTLGMDRSFVLHTPLMWLDKAASWRLAETLGGAPLVALIRDETLSCYRGDAATRHEWGRGCGDCPACDLRRAGWARYRAGPPA